MVKISKRVNGTYYVVEAVPDTNKHELAVVTAYKKKAIEQQTRDAVSPHSDVRNASAGVAFENNISQENGIVNKTEYEHLIQKEDVSHREATASSVDAMPTTSENVPSTKSSSDNIISQDKNIVNGHYMQDGKNNSFLVQRLDAQSRNNEPIAVEDVKKATGIGNEGSKLITDIANNDGVTFSQAERTVKTAYMAGFADVDSAKVDFVTDMQIDAFTAGKKDRAMQDLSAKESAKNVVVNKESGFYAKNLPSDVTKKQVEIVDQIAKAVGVKAYMAEGLEENAELNRAKGEVIIDSDFEREIGTGNNRQNVSIVFHAAHEMALHRVVELAPEEGSAFVYAMYNHLAGNDTANYTLADQKRNAYAEQGVEISLAKAMEEVSANNILYLYNNDETKFQKAIDDILNGTNEKAKQGLKKYVEYLKEIIKKIRDFLTGKTAQERAEIQAELDEITKLRNMFETAFTRAVESRKTAESAAQNSASEMQGETAQKNTNTEVDVSFSLKKTDVDALRSIGRKSVNSFTTEDIKKAEKIAQKYWREMGVKSPFFRAWFGDWRANDATAVKYIPVNIKFIEDRGLIPRGDFINYDTNWNIKSTSDGIDETAAKKTKHSDEYHSLKSIDDMISNAVLLDTVVVTNPSKRMGKNAIFVHHLYCPIIVGNKRAIAKLYVTEDIFDTKRFYLTKIEKVSADVGLNSKETVPDAESISTDTTISISEIFDFVKTHDRDYEKDSKEPVYFNPKPASVVVNKDGTPKIVYHGSDENFTVFDITKSRSWDGTPDYDLPGFYFSESIDESSSYGDVKGFYINISTPYKGNIYALAKEKGSYRKAYEHLIREGYDGVVIDEFGEGENEYIVLKPEQIKSATDNIGTFDKSNPDVNYSLKGTAVEGEIAGLVKKYGTIPAGENPARGVAVPKKTSDKKNVSQTVRTILEAKATPDEALPSIAELVTKGDFSYDVYTDKDAIAEAEESIVKKGWETAKADWYKSVGRGDVSKKNTAEGWVIYNNAVNSGDTETALEALNFMVKHQRSAAQALQATRILKKLSPETQLYGVQKSVTALQEELIGKYGKKAQFLEDVKVEFDDTFSKDVYNRLGMARKEKTVLGRTM